MTTATWHDRRLFLSSTFRDFHAERDHLHSVVFPALEERLRERRCHLVPVDLRWGVETTSQAEADAKELPVLKVCLGEIDRCRPFLLMLLGDRYGWVPPGGRMTAAAREAGFDAELDGKSVTALEVEYGVLARSAEERRVFVYLREPLPYTEMPAAVAATYSEAHAGNPEAAERQRRLAELTGLRPARDARPGAAVPGDLGRRAQPGRGPGRPGPAGDRGPVVGARRRHRGPRPGSRRRLGRTRSGRGWRPLSNTAAGWCRGRDALLDDLTTA